MIAAYGLGMLAVGWYYCAARKTREDYLLGGRHMRPLEVGIAVRRPAQHAFLPGLAGRDDQERADDVRRRLAYPLIALVVGWLMIPFIMQLQVTSAYEILEIRLGLAVRTARLADVPHAAPAVDGGDRLRRRQHGAGARAGAAARVGPGGVRDAGLVTVPTPLWAGCGRWCSPT